MTRRSRLLLFSIVLLLLRATVGIAQHIDISDLDALDQQITQLHRAGRYSEAIPKAATALALREKIFGPEHPEVAQSLNNLAELYREQGRLGDAEPLYKRSLSIREKILGPEHPGTAASLNNLAALLYDAARYSEAEALLKRSVSIRETALGPEHPDVGQSLNNLAELYSQQGRYAEAELFSNKSLIIFEKILGPEHLNVATALNNLAVLYEKEGRYIEAEPLLRRSLGIREKALGPEHPLVAASIRNLASLNIAQGRNEEAELLYKRSIALYEQSLGPHHPSLATTLDALGMLYRKQSRYAEAEALYKRSLAICEQALGPEHPYVATSLSNLAALYRNLKRYTEAELFFNRSLAIYGKALRPEHPYITRALSNLALLYKEQGRYAEAEPLLKESLARDEKVLGPEHPNLAVVLNNLAVIYNIQGRYGEAEVLSRRAVDILAVRIAASDATRPGSAEEELRELRTAFFLDVTVAYEQQGISSDEHSFRTVQLANASSAARALAGMTARFVGGVDRLAGVVRERQDLAQRWQALDAAIVKEVSKPLAARNLEAESQLRASLDDMTKKLDALDSRIANEFPEYAELSNPKPLSTKAAQALLTPGEALLVYLSADDATWIWVLRDNRTAFHKIDLGAKALAHEVSALRGALDPDRNSDFGPFAAKDAHALYKKLLGPALPLLDGVHNLLVVPDGALESLPLGVLVTKPPEHDPQTLADHRDIAWLAREYAITVLPAVSSLRALRQPAKIASAEEPFFGIGNPVLGGRPGGERGVRLASLFRGPLANVNDVRKLAALPETADELRAIAKTLGANESDLLLAEQASEPVLRQRPLDHYRVVHFATHGLVSGDLPGLAEPALVLTPPQAASPENDGLLTASKVATLKLNADWVVLSACNTAADDGKPDAGGLSGLAKAFFYAGARSLLVSHWKVPSNATVTLMTDAFEELKKDSKIGRAEALRRAEIAMLDPANPPEFAHPMAWAPFVLAGEGGAGR